MSTKITKENILEAIESMTVMEVVELVKQMEEKFGVSAAPQAVAAASGAADDAPAAEEQTAFTVILKEASSNKIATIKAVREITGLGLKEAKDAVEAAPTTLKEGVSKADADDFKKKLEDIGAKAELK